MLAWVHQAIAAEREFLESLFELKGDRRMVGSVRRFQASEEEEWIKELMDSAVGKMCVPLKVYYMPSYLRRRFDHALLSRFACCKQCDLRKAV
jgi:hypothetical protein